MDRASAEKFLKALLNSALAVDTLKPCNFRNENDLTPDERELGERWRKFRDQPRPADKLPPKEQVK
jgi:hypothetical protein